VRSARHLRQRFSRYGMKSAASWVRRYVAAHAGQEATKWLLQYRTRIVLSSSFSIANSGGLQWLIPDGHIAKRLQCEGSVSSGVQNSGPHHFVDNARERPVAECVAAEGGGPAALRGTRQTRSQAERPGEPDRGPDKRGDVRVLGGFTIRWLLSRRGKWWLKLTPSEKQRTALLKKLKARLETVE
jgi:hypothetical protein